MSKVTEVAPENVLVAISQVRTDGGTQTRFALDPQVIEEYREAMLAGSEFPPISVFFDGANYWLADGFHRMAARGAAGISSIFATVHMGSRRDAILFSVGANARHGLRRSTEDKRRAVTLLLTDEVWGRWSNRIIADTCDVAHSFVSKIRAEVRPQDINAPRLVHRGEQVYQAAVPRSKPPDLIKLTNKLHGLEWALRYNRERVEMLMKQIEKVKMQMAELSALEGIAGPTVMDEHLATVAR